MYTVERTFVLSTINNEHLEALLAIPKLKSLDKLLFTRISPLGHAIQHGNDVVFENLLYRGASIGKAYFSKVPMSPDDTLIHDAIAGKNLSILKTLMESEEIPQEHKQPFFDFGGYLITAMEYGSEEIIRYILGFDTNIYAISRIKTYLGMSPIEIAKERGMDTIVELLEEIAYQDKYST